VSGELLPGATSFAQAAVRMATPLALAGLGEAYSERSGLLNIGLEAIMLTGAFSGFMVANLTQSLALGILAGALGGLAISLIHAFLSVTCRADQTIAGLALNFFASGLTSYAFLMRFGKTTALAKCPMVPALPIPLLSDIPFLGPVLFRQSVFVYAAFMAVGLSALIFRRTEWGTSLAAVGENPRAADSAGLGVAKTRYVAAAINGCLGGLAGAYLTLGSLGFFMENVTSGRGYIALVVVILGRRAPFGVLLAALLLGAADALQFRAQTLGIDIPSQLFIMFPYVATVVVLLFSFGRSSDPGALGLPFDRSRR
jgi:general nucleoside transport system permease protein